MSLSLFVKTHMYKQQRKRLPPVTQVFFERTGHDTMEVYNPLQGRTETLAPLTLKSLLYSGSDIFFLARIIGDAYVRKDRAASKKAGSMITRRWSPRFDRGLLDIEFEAGAGSTSPRTSTGRASSRCSSRCSNSWRTAHATWTSRGGSWNSSSASGPSSLEIIIAN